MPAALAFLLALAAILAPPAAEAARDDTPHIEAVELVAETAWLAPGRRARVALRIAPEAHWHVYWRNPGDSGLAPSLDWRLPEGVHAGEMQWPEPARIPFGHLVNYGYEGETLFPVEIRADADLRPGRPVRLKATADWLVCREDCVPGSAELTLKLPVKAGAPPPDPRWGPAFDALTTRLPVRLPAWRVSAEARGDAVTLHLRAVADAKRAIASAAFFPYDRGIIANAAPQAVDAKDGAISIRLTKAPQRAEPLERLRGIVVSEDGWDASGARVLEIDVPVSAPPAALGGVTKTGVSLGAALLLAFAGGLILNLMPCVFPVLSIKALGFLRRGGEDPRAARAHGAAFAAGVLASFWTLAGALLALRAAGEQIGWGFQLQSPPFVAAMAFVMFGLGLSLAGVFEIGVGLTAAAGRAGVGSGYAGSFLSGVLATALATPCTAPFMGAALGYALAVPAAESLLVFTALGAGMAAPYAALSASPRLHARLPKPGAWMEGFKQAMAFPMFAAALWLLWVFGRQTGVEALLRLLAGLLALAAAAWVYGRWGSPARAPRARRAAGAMAAILAVAGFAYALPGDAPAAPAGAAASADPGGLPWEPYSETRLAALRAEGRPAFVDFTAAWCITCQVNERVALRADDVRARFAALGVAPLKADWTSRDPEITRALAALGRSGVPVYALYAAGAAEPTLLPSILSPSIVLNALAEIEARS